MEHILDEHRGGVSRHIVDAVQAAAVGGCAAGIGPVSRQQCAHRRQPAELVELQPTLRPDVFGQWRTLLGVAEHQKKVAASVQPLQHRKECGIRRAQRHLCVVQAAKEVEFR